MMKYLLVAGSLALISACQSVPETQIQTYSYDSEQHTGMVHVNEKIYSSTHKTCQAKWRSGAVFDPTGLPLNLTSQGHFSLSLDDGAEAIKRFNFHIPQMDDGDVLLKDYQEYNEYLLEPEVDGILTQGRHFFAPEGYVVRVSDVETTGWWTKACIGIDHMYFLDPEGPDSDPLIILDRVVIPYAQKQGSPISFSFGSEVQHAGELSVKPR
ncbi:MAG: hypothetical protein CMI09_00330 [Oceanospirillaceae bacterium]|nr:hypothetical protein [Oceanospirillaceae bacterium]|tara:strand:- start:26336 stop:26968 length:633 start_codon:yes stop_codon:yes gene_type:complete